jgi:hypothetical protein
VHENVHEVVWSSGVSPDGYPGGIEKYYTMLAEQYRLYTEMADRMSARRSLTNTFFLALNTAILTTLTAALPRQAVNASWLLLPLLVLLIQCAAWFMLMRSYRLLNSAKYRIVGALERVLPARPYSAEWEVVGSGAGRHKYWRLTWLEQWVPVTFAAAYAIGFVSYALWRR